MKNNIINFLTDLIEILNFIVTQLRQMERNPLGYYVYVPQYNKPKHIHTSYKSAQKEVERLHKIFEDRMENVEIQILQILKNEDVDGIPF